MPLNLSAVDTSQGVEKGALYVVATPIGNVEDITLRALRVLSNVDMVAAEDTRHTALIFSRYQILSPLVSYHDHNEAERAPRLIQKLLDGVSIALVADAGTPSVSDPGYRLICSAIQAGIRVIPVPGVSAAIAAVSVSGLPTDAFVFLGFPPKKQARRIALLKDIENEVRTLIFYESPRRVLSFLNDALAVLGDRSGVVCREMTKRYEEFIRGSISEMLTDLSGRREIKGECTLVFSGKNRDNLLSAEALESGVSEYLVCPSESPGELAKKIALKFGISRKTAYQMILSEKTKSGQ